MNHIVPISGGKDSTALALRLREINPDIDYLYVITPTGDELPMMLEHWNKLEKILGKKLIRLGKQNLIEEIKDKMMFPSHHARWCTGQMKLIPVNEFYLENLPSTVYVGLRADEEERKGNSFYDENVTQVYPMREWGWMIGDVYDYLQIKNISIPRRTDCGMCFFQRLDEWYSLWEQYPERYKEYEDLEFFIGHSIMAPRKHKKWSSWLFELRCQFEKGQKPRDVTRSENLKKRLQKQPDFFMKEPEEFDYNMNKKCAVCSI